DPGAPVRRPVHGRPGLFDRQRRVALHSTRVRPVTRAPAMARERVRPDIWRVPAAWRPGRRPVRAAPHVYRWAGPVRVCVVTRRPGAQRVAPDRGADTARG